MKFLYTLIIVGLLFTLGFAEDKDIAEIGYDVTISFFIQSSQYGSTPINTALNEMPASNTNHPGDLECSWYQDGITFMTWYIDSTDGYVSTDTFFPGDLDFGHNVLDAGDGVSMFYYFGTTNFANQGRTEPRTLDNGDTLHVLFQFIDESGNKYYACFDTIFHEFPGAPEIIVDLAWNPGAQCCSTHVCTPCPWGIEEEEKTAPKAYYLAQNSPNPFNSNTTIEYYIPVDADVSIDVFDLNGKKVTSLVSEHQTAGTYSVKWNATDQKGNSVPTGSYFYKIKAGDYETQKRMLYIK